MKLKPLMAAVITLSSMVAFTAQANTTASTKNTAETAPAEKKINDYEAVMVDKVWETTQALDQDKKDISPKNEQVANYFGLAEYYPNGTFKMTTFEGVPKMQGDWSFDAEGKTRSLTAKNDQGDVLFTRVVENITVTPEEYTYRIYPSQDDKSKYFDIVHHVKK